MNSEQKQALLVKGAISTTVIALIVGQIRTGFELKTETVALVVIALLPWLSTILESVELPGGGKLLFREVRAVVVAQQEQIAAQQRVINELVLYSMSFLIFQHLSGIYHGAKRGESYLFQGDLEAFRRDLRFLRDHGYFHHFHVNEVHDKQDLAATLKLTPAGVFYVELREAFEQQKKEQTQEVSKQLKP